MSAAVSRPHAADAAFVQMIGVDKSYGALPPVVKSLNLEIRRGEFLTLLGPSGSGKTTTLMMLAGFENATAGEILVGGRSVNDLPPHRRDIGMVFQSYALFPHMTVAQNLAFPLEVRGRGKAEIESRVAKALEMVELPGYGARRPAQLSGGQQQRVALARALIFEPRLVLLDEPLGALDKQLREQMQYEIKTLHAHLGVTMVYVTHDQSEALTMSDRIAVFDRGEIQQIAAPAEIYERPASAFVARFIGENNALKGTVAARHGSGQCRVRLDGGGEVLASGEVALAEGARVIVSVRPEHVAIAEGPADGVNALAGEVRDLVYHGDHLRARIKVGTSEMLVKVAPGSPAAALVPGAAAWLRWHPRHCRVMRDE